MPTLILFNLLVALLSPELYSQNNQFLAHQRNTLPGTRAAEMAGAYTALADDPSGCFYNPAGIIFARDRELSVSSQAFYQKEIAYKKTINGQDFVEKSSGMYPNFIGGTTKKGSLAGCVNLINLDYQDFNQNDRFENISSSPGSVRDFYRTHQENAYYLMGSAGGAVQLAHQFSIGTTVFAYRRSIQSANHQMVLFNGGSTLVQDAKFSTVNHGYGMITGIVWRHQGFSLGVSMKQSRPFSDKTEGYLDRVTYLETTPPTNTVEKVLSDDASFDELNPSTYRVGIARSHKKFTWSIDLLLHQGKSNSAIVSRAIEEVILEDTYNFSAGMEWIVNKLVWRSGIFSNLSMFPKIEKEKPNQRPHIDYYGLSFGFSFRSSKSENGIGITIQNGNGGAQIISNDATVQAVESQVLILSWNSRYAL